MVDLNAEERIKELQETNKILVTSFIDIILDINDSIKSIEIQQKNIDRKIQRYLQDLKAQKEKQNG